MIEKKRCKACLKSLPLDRFGKHKYERDGLHYYCKDCANKKQNERRKEFVK